MELTAISLFSGIGGDTLAAQWAGFKTLCFVEWDKFCQAVLRKHWPGTPVYGDIDDFDAKQYRGAITLVYGGDPCQPSSIAGQRRGEADDRYKWPQMLRIIHECQPTWVVSENPTGRLTMDFYQVLSDLEGEGYETRSFVIPACAVNAPHRRDRLYIVGHSCGVGLSRKPRRGSRQESKDRFMGVEKDVTNSNNSSTARQREDSRSILRESKSTRLDMGFTASPNAFGAGLEEREEQNLLEQCQTAKRDNQSVADSDSRRKQQSEGNIPESGGWYSYEGWNANWIEVATSLCGVDDGFPFRVDRLKALGNAQVPQQIYPIFKGIAEIERMKTK